MSTPIPSDSPSTTSRQEAQSHRRYGINALLPLLDAVQIGLIQTTVRAYVQEQTASARREALPILEAQSSGVTAVTFELRTLLQLLSWRRLAESEGSQLSDKQLRQWLDDLLDSEQGQAIGNRLNTALGWYGVADNQSADPMIIRQLVWKALMLELDPPELQQPGRIAGYEFGKPKHWGRSLSDIQEEFESFLSWTTRNVQGGRCRRSARLAVCILAPLAPAFAIKGTPPALRYGTGVWVNFAHGVALTEILSPGSSQALSYEQLLDIPIKLSHSATDSERNIIIQTRLAPALQWAIANNVLPIKASWSYSMDELQIAMTALDAHQRKVVSAISTLLRNVPDRLEMGLSTFNEVLGRDAQVLAKLVMRPTTIGKRFEYALRNPAPSVRPGEFYLFDVFVAGFMTEGTDKFEPHLLSSQQDWAPILAPQIERLKGIDITAIYEEAFTAYTRDAQSAYSCLIEMLLVEIPAPDRLAMEYGRVDVYVLERETGVAINKETPRDRELKRGRAGFIVVCNYEGITFAYEVFPLLGILRRRDDFPPLPDGGLVKRVNHEVHRAAVSLPLDWDAYDKPLNPRSGVVSSVIPSHIGHALPGGSTAAICPLSSPRIKSLADGIARTNLFFDNSTELEAHRHQTGSEFVSATYPPVLRILAAFVPGLSCVNAVVNDEAPGIACVIDVGLILASPALKFAKGFVGLVLNAGTPAVGRSLPALATLTGNFMSRSGASYLKGLNPFDGFFFRWGAGPGVSALLIKVTYKLHEAVGQTLGRPGEFAYINGLESAANPHKWRPVAIGDRLATMIYGVSDVPVRDFPAADGSVKTYLINTASGHPYGPPLKEQLLAVMPEVRSGAPAAVEA